jgi:hypothetical protein
MSGAIASASQPRVLGGTGEVDTQAFTHDNRLLVASGYLIHEYDLGGKFLRHHMPYRSRTIAIACFPNDSRVVTASLDGYLWLWNREDDTILGVSRWLPKGVVAGGYWVNEDYPGITISDGGALIAVVNGAVDSTVLGPDLALYDADTFARITAPTDHSHFPRVGPFFSEDGERVYAAYGPREGIPYGIGMKIEEWDLRSDTVRDVDDRIQPYILDAMAQGDEGFVYALGSYDRTTCQLTSVCAGTPILSGSYVTVEWSAWLDLPSAGRTSVLSGTRTREYCGGDVPCRSQSRDFLGLPARLSRRGTYMSRGGALSRIESGEVIGTTYLYDPHFSPHEAYVTTWQNSTWPYPIYLMETSTGDTTAIIKTRLNVSGDSAAANFGTNAILLADSSVVGQLDMVTGEETGRVVLPTLDTGIVISPSGAYVVLWGGLLAYVGSPDGMITNSRIAASERVVSAAVNPVNERLLLVTGDLLEYSVYTQDFAQSPFIRRYGMAMPQNAGYFSAQYTPDGNFLIATTEGPAPRLDFFRTSDGILAKTFPLAEKWWNFRIDPSGEMIAARGQSAFGLFRMDDLGRVPDFSPSVGAYEFPSDSRLLLTVQGHQLQVWRTTTGELLGTVILPSVRETIAILPSPTDDRVYTVGATQVLEWHLPLSETLDSPTRLHLDLLLKREAVIIPPDRNGDGIYDAADVLLEARRAER